MVGVCATLNNPFERARSEVMARFVVRRWWRAAQVPTR